MNVEKRGGKFSSVPIRFTYTPSEDKPDTRFFTITRQNIINNEGKLDVKTVY
jgi:hypothetical protein